MYMYVPSTHTTVVFLVVNCSCHIFIPASRSFILFTTLCNCAHFRTYLDQTFLLYILLRLICWWSSSPLKLGFHSINVWWNKPPDFLPCNTHIIKHTVLPSANSQLNFFVFSLSCRLCTVYPFLYRVCISNTNLII